jgi:hypothetical protein
MRRITLAAAGLCGLLLGACGEESPAAGLSYPKAAAEIEAIKQEADVRAKVTLEDGLWRVAYDFDRPHQALIFERAPGSRAGRWRPLTPGVRVVSAGGIDAMIFDEPSEGAAFAFDPYTQDIPRDYTPFLPFSDGGLALFTGWFMLMTAESLEAIEALGGSFDSWEGEQLTLATTLEADVPLVAEGKRVASPYTDASADGTYIYLGDAAPVSGESFVGIIDQGLPAWLQARLDGDLYAVFLAHEAAWGIELQDKATVLLAYRGADDPGFSNKGSVVGNVLAASVSGQAVLRERPEILPYLNWFFAHEAAHLFHTSAGAPQIDSEDAWMHEGAASAMANGIAGALGGGPDYALKEYATSLERCDATLSGRPGRTIEGGGGDFDVAYHCGALIALLTDAILPEHGIADFWREAGRGWEEGADFRTADYVALLSRLGGEPDQVQALADLIQRSHPDPKAAILEVMTDAGLDPVLGDDGRLAALSFPR